MRLFSPSPLAARIARLLDLSPDEWETSGRHVWLHSSGVSLWVASKDYGLGLSVGHNQRAEPHDGRLPKRDRRHIWRSVNRIMDAQAASLRRRACEALGVKTPDQTGETE